MKRFFAFMFASLISSVATAQYQPPYHHGLNSPGSYYSKGDSGYPPRVFYGGNTYFMTPRFNPPTHQSTHSYPRYNGYRFGYGGSNFGYGSSFSNDYTPAPRHWWEY